MLLEFYINALYSLKENVKNSHYDYAAKVLFLIISDYSKSFLSIKLPQ